jgi:hypothetical protein
MPGFFNSILGFLSRRGVRADSTPPPPNPNARKTPFHTAVIHFPGHPDGNHNDWRFTNIFLHKN